MSRRAIILGSGVCGLAIAHRLLERDPSLDVLLLEREDRPGGLARSLTLGDHVADMGPHRIHTELPDVRAFLETIAGEELVRVQRRSRMWLRKRWIEYPPKPLEILRVLGPLAVARSVGVFAAERAASLFRTRPHRDSYQDVMTRAFGTELYRLIVLGYTRKVWKMPPTQLHGDIARVRVSAGGLDRLVRRVFVREKEGQETALKEFFYLPGGVETLVHRLQERIEAAGARIATATTVTGVEPLAGKRWAVYARNAEGNEQRHEADFLFSTIPVTELNDMLQPHRPNESVARARERMRFIANFLVCLHVKRPQVTPCQWLYFPGRDTIFNRGYEPKNFSSEMGEEDSSLLVLEITCHEGDRIWRAPDWKLIRRTVNDLDAIGLVRRADVIGSLVHRIPHTYPVYDLHYRERMDVMWRYLAEFPNLLSVGRQGLFLHNNMDHSIHMGFRAADVMQVEEPEAPEKRFYNEVRRFQQFRIVD